MTTEVPGYDPRYAELNREFHFTVYEYAHSPLLLSLMRPLGHISTSWARIR